jgi:hypothetical protein
MSYEKIQLAIDTSQLSKDMCEIVEPPKQEEIQHASEKLKIALSKDHVDLLTEWGGSILDEIRINSLEKVLYSEEGYIEFANDYNGFIYKYDKNGHVFSEDTDGGEVKQLANSVSEFINDFFLGEKGKEYYGDDWVNDLKKNNLV